MQIFRSLRGALTLPLHLFQLVCGVSFISAKRQRAMEAALAAESDEDFVPVLRLAVCSDTHLCKADEPRNANRLAALFDAAYAYADSRAQYPSLDAVLVAGDLVNSGADEEYAEFRRVVNEKMRPDTRLIPVMGNHEYGVGGHAGYVRNMGQPLLNHATVKGFHIIGMSTGPSDTWHTPAQLLWLRRALRRAAKDAPDRPIFTMQHGHIWNTVYVSRSWYTQMSLPLFLISARYPQIVNFSGHSHGPINHPLTVFQCGFTQVGTGTLSFFEMERDISDNTVPPGSENAAQFHIVEVDARNRVRIKPFNLLTGDFFRETGTAEEEEKRQLVFRINEPADPRAFAYTAARKKTAGLPRFAPDAALNIERIGQTEIEVSFPQAQDALCVYGYRLTAAWKTAGKRGRRVKEIYSEYYFEPTPQVLRCTLQDLCPGRRYTLTAEPLNIWRKAGAPMTAEFSTAP